MTTISSKTVIDLYYSTVVFEIHQTENKLELFRKKYNSSFNDFEKKIKSSGKENIKYWDDYIEWKGLSKYYQDILSKKKDLDEGNIKIT
jgi:hypothetical protein